MKANFIIHNLLASLLLFVLPATAHHSASIFDTEREVILQGIITSVNWLKPHVSINIEIVDSGESRINIRVAGPTPAALELVGWTEHSLRSGEAIIVVANPSTNTSMVLGNSILKEDGEYLPMGGMRLQQALADKRSAQ